MPLLMEIETIASPEEPLLEAGIKIDPVMISELLMEMDSMPPISGSMPSTQPLRSAMNARPSSAGNLNATSDTLLRMKLSGCGILLGRLLSSRLHHNRADMDRHFNGIR
jgi:hypothetical protein